MEARRRPGRPGVNLIEVLIAATVAGTVMLAIGGFITSTYKATGSDRDRTYAMQKALQMMEEMAAYQPSGVTDSIDKFANDYQYTLTIADAAPGKALSGNQLKDATRSQTIWKFVRKITVDTIEGDESARLVTVAVYKAKEGANPPAPEDANKPLAVVSNVLRSNWLGSGPKQEYDVYVISIDNMPHIFRKDDDEFYYPSTTEARAQFNAALTKMKSTNSGIAFRTHWITRLSEGRDDQYRPYINQGMSLHNAPSSSLRDPLNKLYFYPGTIGQGTDSDPYFDPEAIMGRIAKGDASGVGVNSGNYAMCDQFNHAVRYPEEFTALSTSVFGPPKMPNDPSGNPLTEPSLRQLLEELTSGDKDKYRNAIVVNLNGELFPVVPLRNYSDPAKHPAASDATKAQRRLVTHPFRLVTPILTEPVRLLVHPFLANGADTPSNDTGNDKFIDIDWGPDDYSRTARIVVKGVKNYLANHPADTLDLVGTPGINDIKIDVIQRAQLNAGNANANYVKLQDWPGTGDGDEASGRKAHTGPHAADHAEGVHHGGSGTTGSHGTAPTFTDFTGDGTADDLLITLSDLDYDARKSDNSGTLYGIPGNNGDGSSSSDKDYMPHRMQYFPDPFLPFLDAANGLIKPRNTARVIIEFYLKTTGSPNALSSKFEVETQLRKTGTTWPPAAGDWPAAATDPAVSRTWLYTDNLTSTMWNSTRGLYWDTTNDEPALPITEQVQLVGDPRHNPYLDVRRNNLFNPYFTEWLVDDAVYFKDLIKNHATDVNKALDGYNALIPAAEKPPMISTAYDVKFPGSADDWHETKINMPAYLRIWRYAMVRNNLVFVNPTGDALRFVGLGGEFQLDGYVNDIGDLHISDNPYNEDSTADADSEAAELVSAKAPVFERITGDMWYDKPWIGELYPSDKWSEWNGSGNLDCGNDIRREGLSDLTTNYAWATDSDSNHNKRKIQDDVGLAAFLNAEDSAGSGPLEYDTGGSSGTQTASGKKAADALRQQLKGSQKANWGYKLNGADTADTPIEWSTAPYNAAGERLLMDWLNVSASPGPGYFTQNQASGYFAVNPILLMTSTTASSSKKAIVVPVTMRPERATDVVSVLETAMVSALNAYLDGTNNALSANHIQPVSRVKIKNPRQDETLANSYTLEWYARWTKVDGTEFSPFYTFSTGSAPTLVHFFKYQVKNSGNWKARDGSASALGVPDPAGLEIANQAYPNPITYAWNNSALAAGEYELRIETYRKIGGVIQEQHYAHHTITAKLD